MFWNRSSHNFVLACPPNRACFWKHLCWPLKSAQKTQGKNQIWRLFICHFAFEFFMRGEEGASTQAFAILQYLLPWQWQCQLSISPWGPQFSACVKSFTTVGRNLSLSYDLKHFGNYTISCQSFSFHNKIANQKFKVEATFPTVMNGTPRYY